MAAILVMPSEDEWPIIKAFLGKCHEGAIVVAPDIAKDLVEQVADKTGVEISDGDYFEYEFGGSPDICIDVVITLDHLAAEYLIGEGEDDDNGEY
jgi:hypothetical protein